MIQAILRRVTLALAAAAILAASAGVCVVALAFALYALVRPELGPAGAAAVVAGAAVGMLLLGALLLFLAARMKPAKRKPIEPGARFSGFFKERPVTAVAAAIGAGLLAVRNPRYLADAVRSFVDGLDRTPRKRR